MSVSTRLKLDEGCNYLLFNRTTGLANNDEWLSYLRSKLTPLNILPLLDKDEIGDFRLTNAYGILPGWAHVPLSAENTSVPAKRNVTLAFPHQHPVYPHVAAAMRKLLADDGLKLKVLELSTMEILSGKHAEKK